MEGYINGALEECDVYKVSVCRAAAQWPEPFGTCRWRAENVFAQVYVAVFDLEAAFEIGVASVCHLGCSCKASLD